MVSIQVDEQTAKALHAAADVAGVSLADFIRSLVVARPTAAPQMPWEMLEREIIELSVDGSLPNDFSRADMYTDHD